MKIIENILLIGVILIAVVGLIMIGIEQLDAKIEKECADRTMDNPPEYCQQYWKQGETK